MTAFVKPLVLSVFAAGSLAVAGGQPPEPPQPPAVPPSGFVPAVRVETPRVAVTGDGTRTYFTENVIVRSLGDDPRTRELAKKLAEAKDDETKEKLRGELKVALAKAFDDRQKGQEKQVADLEAQLKRLKDTIGKRKEAKADIIADRLTALEKEAKGLGW